MSTARIEELRKKFDENPRRYFAPLANEYRKAGDLTRALELCREHLPKQPGHMSGHIVFGQALYEAGALDEAQVVFEAALSLDPENLIALRHLGEIARAHGDSALARRWYERVLDADPHNDDIAHQLSSLVTPVSTRTVPTPAAPVPATTWSHDASSHEKAVDEIVVAHDQQHDVDDASSMLSFEQPNVDGLQTTSVSEHSEVHEQQADTGESMADLASNIEHGEFETAQDQRIDIEPDLLIGTHDQVADAQALDDAFAQADNAQAIEGLDVHEFEADSFASQSLLADDEGVTPEGASNNAAAPDIQLVDVLGAFSAHDPEAAMDPDHFGPPSAEAKVEELSSINDLEVSAEFEEGLFAPEWPDTTELFARAEHPPTVSQTTPVYSVEAVEAFGRERVDPELPPPLDEIEQGERVDDESAEHTSAQDATPVDAGGTESTSIVAERDELEAVTHVEADEPVEAQQPNEPVEAEQANEPVEAQQANEPVELQQQNVEAEHVDVEAVQSESVEEQRASEPVHHDSLQPQPLSEDASERTTASDHVEHGVPAEHEQVVEASEADDWLTSPLYDDASVGNVQETRSSELTFIDAGEPAAPQTESATDSSYQPFAEPDVTAHHDDATESSAFVTETMAELLLSQGFVERALNVYEELVRRRPHDAALAARLDEVRQQSVAPTPVSSPLHAQSPLQTPAGANEADVHAVDVEAHAGVDAIDDQTSAATSSAHDVIESASRAAHVAESTSLHSVDDRHEQSARLTARERFARLASRRVPRRTPPRAAVAVETPAEGLAGLFGAIAADSESTDDFAARAFADAFSDIPDEPIAPDPVIVTRTATPPISGLSLSSAFSFDRFFPDPAMKSPSAAPSVAPPSAGTAPSAPTPAPQAPVSDDLAEFAAWLKGLDQK